MPGSPQTFSLDDPAFRALLDLAPVAIGIARAGKIIYGNPAYRRLFGYGLDEAIEGHSALEHIALKARPEFENRLKRRIAGAWTTDKFETRGLRRGGEEFDQEVSTIRISLVDGEAALAFIADISDRKQAEEILKEQEARFKAIFMNAGIGMALVAMDRTPILVNPVMQKMLGYTEAELQKMTIDQVSLPEDDKKGLAFLKEIVEGRRESYNTEKRYRRKDGAIVWASLTVSVVRGPGGKPHYLIGLIEDITERMKQKG